MFYRKMKKNLKIRSAHLNLKELVKNMLVYLFDKINHKSMNFDGDKMFTSISTI